MKRPNKHKNGRAIPKSPINLLRFLYEMTMSFDLFPNILPSSSMTDYLRRAPRTGSDSNSYDNIPFLVPALDIPVCIDDFFQPINSIDNGFDFPVLHHLL